MMDATQRRVLAERLIAMAEREERMAWGVRVISPNAGAAEMMRAATLREAAAELIRLDAPVSP